MKFKGTIIITDPCYILKDEDKYNIDLQNLPLKTYISEGTIYGDWSCTTFELGKPLEDPENEIGLLTEGDVKSTLGQFCADAGMVGVFLLEELLEYNPDFDYHTTKPWTTTVIENFDGDIDYVIASSEDDEDESVYQSAHIVGKGNINFVTMQTGF